jgi:hypothetical protein
MELLTSPCQAGYLLIRYYVAAAQPDTRGLALSPDELAYIFVTMEITFFIQRERL